MIDTSYATKEALHSRGFPLLEFDRHPYDRQKRSGFLLGVTERFTLLHVVEDQTYSLDGYALFPNLTVRRWRCVDPQTFLARAVTHKSLKPKLPKGLQFETWQEVFASAGSQFPLLTIHREQGKKNACWIGRFVKVSQRSVTIHYLNPDAAWDGPDTYKLSEITRVEFGGAYEALLATLAPAIRISRKER